MFTRLVTRIWRGVKGKAEVKGEGEVEVESNE